MLASLILVFFTALQVATQSNFTIINGQIYTPGLAIVDAPQPFTPEGGDFLQVALDVSGDGHLSLPPYGYNASTQIFNITIFLFSYDTGKNLTISNGTAGPENEHTGNIMLQESGSTVKHVNWIWPDCLVGDGGDKPSPTADPPVSSPTPSPTYNCSCESARGAYNISIHQSFRINGTNYYTIFDLPIYVINSIPQKPNRLSCTSLNNPLLSQSALKSSVDTLSFQPWVGGGASITGSSIPPAANNSATGSNSNGANGINSNSGDKGGGLGSAGVSVRWPFYLSMSWLAMTAFFISL